MSTLHRAVLPWAVTLPVASSASFARQGAGPSGYPGEPTLRLDSLLAIARENNATLVADRLGAKAMSYRADQVSARPDPMVGVVILPTPPSPWLGFQRSQWRLEQEFMYPGKRSLMGRMAELEAEEMSAGVDAMALDVEMEVKTAYFDLVLAVRQTRVIRSFQEDIQRFEDIATIQYEVGTGMQQAILAAQLVKCQTNFR